MKRFLAIQLENGGEFYEPIDYIPPHWGEKRVQLEFAECLLIMAINGEDTIMLSDGVEIPLLAIEDFHLVERGIR